MVTARKLPLCDKLICAALSGNRVQISDGFKPIQDARTLRRNDLGNWSLAGNSVLSESYWSKLNEGGLRLSPKC